jgi:CheY-like chemotaxis protein
MKKVTHLVLIVEDDASQRNWLARVIATAGYTFDVALDGREALQMIERNPYSLLIVDLVMPVVSGFEVLSELSRRNLKIPTVITSGIIVPEVHHYMKTHEKVVLLSKPLSEGTLMEAIHSLIPPSSRRQKG